MRQFRFITAKLFSYCFGGYFLRPGRLFRNPFTETMNAVIRVLDDVAGLRCGTHRVGGNAVMCVKFYLTRWRPYLERHKPVAVPFVAILKVRAQITTA